ncbi:MAG: protein kinase [Leptolyngbyaceae cyanobacterium bins.59]|nr:protein kinase [Leptolyngbyaceae cyanobacterium bins.59]
MTDTAGKSSPPRVLQNRYELRNQLGKREEQRTLLALDRQTKTPVVLKFLLFPPELPADRLEKLEKTSTTLKALFHPAIPTYLDSFVIDLPPVKAFVVVQEYVEAQSLKEYLKTGQILTESEARNMARNILDILAYLHGLPTPVIHSNIKSSNVLLAKPREGTTVGRGDRLFLTDFGALQAAVTPDDSTSRITNNFIHMPPEQFAGRPLLASDLYALGMTLIDSLTTVSMMELPRRKQRILFEEAMNVSPGFADWLKRITEPDTAFRFPSVQVALDALEKLMAQ